MVHRIMKFVQVFVFSAACFLLLSTSIVTAQSQAKAAQQNPNHLFAMPRVAEHLRSVAIALGTKRFEAAEKALIRLTEIYPWHMESHYILASLQSTQKKTNEAFASLEKAIELGFSNQALLYKDKNLAPLRADKRFQKIAEELVKQSTPPKTATKLPVTASAVRDANAIVSKNNTVWDGRIGLLKSYFKFNSRKATSSKVQTTKDAAEELNTLFKRGLAAGNIGDIYDNRDRRHSTLQPKAYPQLAFSKYSETAQKLDIDYGLNTKIIFSGVTFGNSSTAISSGPLWRSQARLALTIPGGPQKLFLQYLNNQLYVFPAVRDFSSKDDLLTANTPYMILSEGKSGSDRPFLRAIATILAALNPAEKDLLSKTGKLMPAVQMIFRRGQKNVNSDAEYLSGKAHPPVFQKKNIDLLKMIRIANNIKAEEFPSVVQLKVQQESGPQSGIDDFSRDLPEQIFDTPASIARVIRNSAYIKSMVIEAQSSKQKSNAKMTYKWVILQGDRNKVSIIPLDKSGGKVEIKSSWHDEFVMNGRPDINTNRVEIAVFADNGKQLSAPSFVTLLYPENEERTYTKEGTLLSIDHRNIGNQYVDPQVFAKRAWMDTFSYDGAGRLSGWKRAQKSGKSEFTRHGARIVEKDTKGRAIKAEQIGYQYTRVKSGHMVVTEKSLRSFLEYQYLNDEDRLGILVKK